MAIPRGNPYREALAKLVNSIQKETGMEEEDCILILHLLDDEEKISRFAEWMNSKMTGSLLTVKNAEITRAAVKISKGLEP